METQNTNNEGLIAGITYDTEPEKRYLVLIEAIDRETESQYREWEFVSGRQTAYDYIKRMIESDYIIVDVLESKIIVDSDKVKVSEGISIYEFMKSMKELDKIIDFSSFDIDDYTTNGESEGVE